MKARSECERGGGRGEAGDWGVKVLCGERRDEARWSFKRAFGAKPDVLVTSRGERSRAALGSTAALQLNKALCERVQDIEISNL